MGIGPRSYRIEHQLPERLDSIRMSREMTWRALTTCGYRGHREDVIFVVSELVTNALRHGSGAPTLCLTGGSSLVRVEVGDAGAELPPLGMEPGPGGRGLDVVRRLCSGWGVSPLQRGKVVWCELEAYLTVVVGGHDPAIA
ncbi:ATP-binding protein [Microbispora sp. ATCC PTA-5024]|uniref:ATP-binding protein n=1 Tax=Microbispora sp. ATCC PTA-5024 TaxID=316330 RepID=UPI0003DDEEFD|nr:ATP-binding protein [Microbispora sp. ATCC PTA-5024]ETK37045.1 hypothetical protein MPTA5024_05925 [Microbispora sp. ATCC PTA-5024]